MQLPTPERLRQKRIELNLTQSGLAKRAGVSQPLIARIESGDVDPRLSTLRKIFTAFEEVEKEKILAKDIMHTLVIFVSSEDSVESAVNLMEKHGFSQVPVIDNGVPVGSISEDTIIKYMADRKASTISQMKIKDMMGDAFPTVSPTTELDVISHMLERNPAVLVLEKGVTTGFVTKHDVIKLLHG
ncbi:CBS domain-containing protein [Methanococcoides sp. NM1]|uniref:CBS domain-containing protein n=1 Tax=Methanococcoides sp. NM1 TaxID=1201013 RepID=UPI001083D310|nr:CBS domain-containing protein [Methanococcoides sp. NM1]